MEPYLANRAIRTVQRHKNTQSMQGIKTYQTCLEHKDLLEHEGTLLKSHMGMKLGGALNIITREVLLNVWAVTSCCSV